LEQAELKEYKTIQKSNKTLQNMTKTDKIPKKSQMSDHLRQKKKANKFWLSYYLINKPIS